MAKQWKFHSIKTGSCLEVFVFFLNQKLSFKTVSSISPRVINWHREIIIFQNFVLKDWKIQTVSMELNKQVFKSKAFKDLVRVKWASKTIKKAQDSWELKYRKFRTWVIKWKKLIATAKTFLMGIWLLVTAQNAALNGFISRA